MSIELARKPKPLAWLRPLLTNETFQYIAKRVLQAIITLLLASALSFLIVQLSPGSFLDTLKQQNEKISPARLLEIQQQFGLSSEKTLGAAIVQYLSWLQRVVFHWDFGFSISYNRPVSEMLGQRIRATVELALASTLVTWLVAIPLGIWGAVHQNKTSDNILRVLSYLGQGFPSFIAALLLVMLAQYLSPYLPVGGRTSITHDQMSPIGQILDIGWHMILPTIALSITSFASLQRIARGEMLDVLRQDYIQTARAKGLPENRVIYVHALRNAINPLITLLGFEFAALLGGAFIAEFFFNWPGLGRLILSAVNAKDLYLVMGSLMMGAVMLILGNLMADLLLKAVDPRIKLSDLNNSGSVGFGSAQPTLTSKTAGQIYKSLQIR
jgi:peptide/nickel transport system permease protein